MAEKRLHNFNPGPAVLPEEVVSEARANLANYRGTGIGVMEMSHRSREFEGILRGCESDLRELLGIGDDYSVLFMSGGGSTQFSMVPMNLLRGGTQANYILSGVWAEAAAKEAGKFGEVHIAASSKDDEYRHIPRTHALSSKPAYLHFTSNNTVIGTQFDTEPDAGDTPLVCDASSDLLGRQIDISRYSLIYAGAQKNLGPAGTTLVIIRNSLLEAIPDGLPLMLDYRTFSKNASLYNTPPTFPIYIVGLVLQWIKRLGGVTAIERINRAKAKLVYDALDAAPIYQPFVERSSRSLMNITFRLNPHSLEDRLITEAEARGLVGLRGHRLVGGVRASLYNACPMESAQALAAFLSDFAAKNG